MNYYIFKASDDIKSAKPLEVHKSEITESLIELRSLRYGPIQVVSEEELEKRKNGI